MPEISLLRAQPDTVAPPTGHFSYYLLWKNKTERPLHEGQHYSKPSHHWMCILTQWGGKKSALSFYQCLFVLFCVSKPCETGFSTPLKSWSGVNVTWHHPKHTCSTYMIEVRVERTHVTITCYEFFPVFTRGHSGVTSRQTECDVTAPITVNYRKVRVVNQTVSICRNHGE